MVDIINIQTGQKIYKDANELFESFKDKFQEVLIIGKDDKGLLHFNCTNNIDNEAELIWLLELFKHDILTKKFMRDEYDSK